jgi:cytochrome c-type biogenesis protein CcmH/NrfF
MKPFREWTAEQLWSLPLILIVMLCELIVVVGITAWEFVSQHEFNDA